jgi:hypothetical protein
VGVCVHFLFPGSSQQVGDDPNGEGGSGGTIKQYGGVRGNWVRRAWANGSNASSPGHALLATHWFMRNHSAGSPTASPGVSVEKLGPEPLKQVKPGPRGQQAGFGNECWDCLMLWGTRCGEQ